MDTNTSDEMGLFSKCAYHKCGYIAAKSFCGGRHASDKHISTGIIAWGRVLGCMADMKPMGCCMEFFIVYQCGQVYLLRIMGQHKMFSK